MRTTFESLTHRYFRRWALASFVSATGFWMQRVAQDWFLLTELSDESATAVGILTGLQFAPFLLLMPLSGVVADRFPKRNVIMATDIGAALTAGALGLLILAGHIQVWQLYTLAFLQGIFAAISQPARIAIVSELVPKEILPNAVGLNATAFHGSRLIGPGVAGLMMAAWGAGPVIVANAATFAYVALTVWSIPATALDTGDGSREAGDRGRFRDGLRYLRSQRELWAITIMMFFIGAMTINFQLTIAIMARLAFEKEAGQYGLLGSILAIGSVTGTLIAARRKNVNHVDIGTSALIFGLATIVAGLMPNYVTFAISLVACGLTALILMTTANMAVQLGSVSSMRGRAMAVYSGMGIGGTIVGGPLVGWIGEIAGARWTLIVGGLVAVLGGLWLRKFSTTDE